MNKYQEALDRIKDFDYPPKSELGKRFELIQNLIDKRNHLIEYLIGQKIGHTMSRFVSVGELESFRYAIDLILDYLDKGDSDDKV